MSKLDILIAPILGIVISLTNSFILNGPFLSLGDYLISTFLGAMGWFAGTAIFNLIGTYIDKRRKEYRRVLWIIVLVLAILLSIFLIVYNISFLTGKTSYETHELIVHFIVILVCAILIRVFLLCAQEAIKRR